MERYIHPYRNGRDLAARPRGLLVIDFFGLDVDFVKRSFPEAYQHLSLTVRKSRENVARCSLSKDAQAYLRYWWIFGKPRQELRPAINNITRYIATIDTSRHRIFQFLPSDVICDDKNVIVASDDGFVLGVLSARAHVVHALRAGGWLGVGNDAVYSKTRTFDPFPFPDADGLQRQRIRAIAEDLDAHRKRVLAAHTHLTLTGLYNVLERLRAGVDPAGLDPAARRTFDDGLVRILKELHDRLDLAVAEAYGWPADLSDDELLARLVALNGERAAEEARGFVRWLRPDYQVPRFGSTKEKAELDLVGGADRREAVASAGPKPTYPVDDMAQTAVVIAALMRASGALDAAGIASCFKQGRRVTPKVAAVLLSLYRMGLVATADGGASFALPRPG